VHVRLLVRFMLCCTDLLLSPWWIAGIVAACVIALMIIFGLCICCCRCNWADMCNRDMCYNPNGWLACCVTLRLPRTNQPYRRRHRSVYPTVIGSRGSIDRSPYKGTILVAIHEARTVYTMWPFSGC